MGGGGSSTPKPTAAENAQGDVARQQWNEYVENWHKPIMDWAHKVGTRSAQATDERMLRGIGSADISQAGRSLKPVADPSHGRVVTGLFDAWGTSGAAQAGMSAQARQGADSRRVAALTQIANIGMGQKTEALSGINDVARGATAKAISSAQTKFESRNNTKNMVAGIAGTGAGMLYESREKTKQE